MQRWVRVGVVGCIVIATALGLSYLVRAVDRLDDSASTNAAMNFDDREFGGGNSIVVDKRGLYAARSLIPEDGRYRVATGPGVAGATELTEPYIDQFARYFLMPRRPDPRASWILCYGCDPSSIAGRTETEWDNGAGISILRAIR
jgi:hypothetical protein